MTFRASRYMLAIAAGCGLGTGLAPASAEAGSSPCLLIGDSTIVGSSRELQRLLGGNCAVAAKVGASTAAAAGWANPAASYAIAVIGTGSNDASSPALAERLASLRAKVKAQKVIWLAPYAKRARALVEQVAAGSGDSVVPLASFASRDGIHPANYTLVARTLVEGNAAAPQPARASAPPRMATAAPPRATRALRASQAAAAAPAPAAAWPARPYREARAVLVARPRIAHAAIARPVISRPVIAIAALPAPGSD